MGRTALLYVLLLGSACAAMLLGANGCSGKFFQNPFGSSKIQHVVIVFQENRTPDNLFQDPVLISAGADIASSGLSSSGQVIPLTPESLGVNYDLSHAHSAFVAQYDGGKMDGADLVPTVCYVAPCPSDPQYFYVQGSDVQPYFQMAEQYTFGDRMFQTNEGPSFPAHQFIISGTSAPTATSNLFVAENTTGGTGCAAPPTALVLCSRSSRERIEHDLPVHGPSDADRPAQRQGSVLALLHSRSQLDLDRSERHSAHVQPECCASERHGLIGSDWVNHVVIYNKQSPAPILTDIANDQLPAVSWVIPAGKNSDHPGLRLGIGGPSWVASIVNAIGNSSYWANTAIIVTWDDWGGWYDHVPPPQVIDDGSSWGSGYVYGFRVPLIVISPYAKAAYISHVTTTLAAFSIYGGELSAFLARVCRCLRADDLSDCFNFNQTPLAFNTINAPLTASHFLNDRTPPDDPDDD